ARIDENGRTSVPGLFAIGECASGMHGANRIGGAMVAATQVFGARAGRAAGLDAVSRDHTPEKEFKELTLDPDALPEKTLRIPQNGPTRNNGAPLTKAMHGHVALTGSRRLGSVIQGLEKRLGSEKKPDRVLAVESALIVTRFLRKMKANSNGPHGNQRLQ
ncbi:MAG: FAD-binding protein, partial [Thermodesulfobacteriota bacterium]|nr:FAD-binding protein [Thermodesulfobacteriota bacterium]